MTQKEMAELLGVTNKAVSKWETSQGMPDIGILPELGKALGVTVDEILMGEQIEQEKRAETAVSDEDKKLLEIVLERAERKAETIRITWKDVFGCLLILSAVGLIIVQIWTLTQGRELGLIYIRNVTPYVINAAAVFLFWAGGMCIENSARYGKKICYCSNGDFISCRNCGLSILFSKAEGNR